jgi:hypothetical protein
MTRAIRKTNTPEFGAGSQTYNALFGETRKLPVSKWPHRAYPFAGQVDILPAPN